MVQATPHLSGLNHRTKRRMDLSQAAYNGLDEARTYYYSANWQVLEEHIDTDLDDDTDRIGQQFWGVRYIDDAVAKRVDREGDGSFSSAKEHNFYYLTDVMFSVRALADSSGLLHTRLDYTPYGVAMHGKAADINGDGEVNFFDLTAFLAFVNGALKPGDAGYDPDADLSAKGDLNFTDVVAYQARYNAYGVGGPTFNAGWIDNPSDPNGPDNSVGYDGYWFDLAGATEATSTGLYMVRNRVYDPKLGRWLQRDPAGYVDGQGEYQFSLSSPNNYFDSTGTSASRDPQLHLRPSFEHDSILQEAMKDPRVQAAIARAMSACRNADPLHPLDLPLLILDARNVWESWVPLKILAPPPVRVVIGTKSFARTARGRKDDVKNAVDALLHELTHARQYCEQGRKFYRSANDAICAEIEAYCAEPSRNCEIDGDEANCRAACDSAKVKFKGKNSAQDCEARCRAIITKCRCGKHAA